MFLIINEIVKSQSGRGKVLQIWVKYKFNQSRLWFSILLAARLMAGEKYHEQLIKNEKWFPHFDFIHLHS